MLITNLMIIEDSPGILQLLERKKPMLNARMCITIDMIFSDSADLKEQEQPKSIQLSLEQSVFNQESMAYRFLRNWPKAIQACQAKVDLQQSTAPEDVTGVVTHLVDLADVWHVQGYFSNACIRCIVMLVIIQPLKTSSTVCISS